MSFPMESKAKASQISQLFKMIFYSQLARLNPHSINCLEAGVHMFLVVFHVHHFPSKDNRRFSKLKWFKVIQEELYKPVVRVLVKFYAIRL